MRTRLSTAQRRAQLLAIGAELFANRPYAEVSIEEVADIAQVSAGLLYHYFSSKRDFFLAVVEDQSTQLLHASTPNPEMPPLEQLKAGLEVYIDYAQRHPDGFRVVHRAGFTDGDQRRIHEKRVAAHRDAILAGLGEVMTLNAEARIAVTAWLVFVPSAIVDWLDNPTITRDQLRDLCARALWAAAGVQEVAEAGPRP